jgi:peptidyl-prolyl cis-trans isomerase D
MLEQMRKHMNWILWLTLALIIVTFLFFGIYPSSSAGRYAAKVNGDVISSEEWTRAYQNLAENYRQIFKDQFNEGLQKLLRRQALQELIQSRLLSQEADRMGLRISDEELQASITQIPAFSPGGKFDSRTYRMYLDRVNLSPAMFEASQREALRRQRLVQIVEDSVAVTDDEVAAAMAVAPKKKPADKEALRQQILMKKRQQALTAYITSLQQKAKITIGEKFASL